MSTCTYGSPYAGDCLPLLPTERRGFGRRKGRAYESFTEALALSRSYGDRVAEAYALIGMSTAYDAKGLQDATKSDLAHQAHTIAQQARSPCAVASPACHWTVQWDARGAARVASFVLRRAQVYGRALARYQAEAPPLLLPPFGEKPAFTTLRNKLFVGEARRRRPTKTIRRMPRQRSRLPPAAHARARATGAWRRRAGEVPAAAGHRPSSRAETA